jgi:hypothetical protein
VKTINAIRNSSIISGSGIKTKKNRQRRIEGNESDVKEMKRQLQNQGFVIQELESYGALCEKRILELCPTHPLPIQHNQLGRGICPLLILNLEVPQIKKEAEIQQLQQKIIDLQLRLEARRFVK